MICPPPLRGQYYTTETVVLCHRHRDCPVCYRCFNYSSSSTKCGRCESGKRKSKGDPDISRPLVCTHQTKPGLLEDAQLIVRHYRSPLYHPQRELSNSVYTPQSSEREKALLEELGDLLGKYQPEDEGTT